MLLCRCRLLQILRLCTGQRSMNWDRSKFMEWKYWNFRKWLKNENVSMISNESRAVRWIFRINFNQNFFFLPPPAVQWVCQQDQNQSSSHRFNRFHSSQRLRAPRLHDAQFFLPHHALETLDDLRSTSTADFLLLWNLEFDSSLVEFDQVKSWNQTEPFRLATFGSRVNFVFHRI